LIAPPTPINGTEPGVRPVIVSLEVVAFVALNRVIVPDAAVRSVTARVEIVVVARLDVPVTAKVLVVVAFVVVRLVMKAVAADNRLEKKFVEVAVSKKALVA
jgi:biotin synthase-like enzyme